MTRQKNVNVTAKWINKPIYGNGTHQNGSVTGERINKRL